MKIDLGRVVPIYRKEYHDSVAYELNDIVLYTDGNIYWHTADGVTTGVSPSDSSVWTLAFSGSELLNAMIGHVTSAMSAKKSAELFAKDAEDSASTAKTCSDAAILSKSAAENAEKNAKESEASAKSYAVGGTGTREDEDTDNSKHYAETAELSANASKNAQERAENAAIRQPYPNQETDTWWVWNANSDSYVDSNVKLIHADMNASAGYPGYVQNRTHYVEGELIDIQWDGNLDGHVSALVDYEIGSGISKQGFVKISEYIEKEKLNNAIVHDWWNDDQYDCGIFEQQEWNEEGIYESEFASILIAEKAGSASDGEFSIPEPGVYTRYESSVDKDTGEILHSAYTYSISKDTRNYVPLDPKFIPDSVKNTFLVTAEYNDDGTGIDFISHTFDEIYNAHSKGKNIFLNVSYSDTYYLAYIDDGGAEFVNLMPLVASDIWIYQDGSSELLIYNLVDFEDLLGFIEYVLQHQKDSSIHVTEEEKKEWNEKADLAVVSGLISGHTKDSSIHVSEEEKSAWNNKVDPDAVYSKDESLSDATKELYGLEQSAVPNDVLGKLQTSVLLNKIHLSLPETPDHWRRVAFGNGMFVAIPVSGNICAYSHDGIKWEQSTLSETSRGWQSVCFGAGKFVALASNYAAYSVDGVTWVESSIPTGPQWFDVAYGNGRFVAIALNRVSAYSEDGLTWTETQFPGISFGNIGFGNGTFIVSGSDRNRYLYYGVDGITWNQIILPYSNRWTAPCYGKDKFVLVAYASASYDETNCALYSEDGITWEETYLPCNSYWYRVDNVNGIFVAVSVTGKLAYSTDGINWAESNSPPSSAHSVAYGNGIFVAVSQKFDYASYSRDGIKWKDEVYILNDVKSCGITEYVIEALLAENQEDLKGNPGYTPQRGVDYWTTEDQQAIVDTVLAALPDGDEEEF